MVLRSTAGRVCARLWSSIRSDCDCHQGLPELSWYLRRRAALYAGSGRAFSSGGLADSEAPHESDAYRVDVLTGICRGAGTKARAWIQLVGAHGTSDKVCFGADSSSDDGFPRGSQLSMQLLAPRDMGPLKRVYVERAKRSASDLGDGWFLEQIEVHGPHGERTVFPCHSWLGSSDCGNINCPLERNLIPADPCSGVQQFAPQPVTVVSAGVAYPHPDKVRNDGVRAVNTKHFGHGGEDAYFHITGK